MAVAPEKLGRDLVVSFTGGLLTLGTLMCTTKSLPGFEPSPAIDATTDDASLTTRVTYWGLSKQSDITLTIIYDATIMDIALGLNSSKTSGNIIITSGATSKVSTTAEAVVIGCTAGGVDNDGLPTMDLVIGLTGGLTANDPVIT